MSTTTKDWEAEALSLKDQGLSTAEIADQVGKHPASVRRLVARQPEPSSNGNGNGHGPIDAATAARLRDAATGDGDPPAGPIPGQIDIDGDEVMGGALSSGPEEERDPTPGYDKEALEAEAGEAVGPMPPREMDGGELVTEIRLQGTRQLAIDFGPAADIPTGGTLVVKSEKLASGHFGLGDVITGTFTARITDAGGKERVDKLSEEWRAKPTAYVATITELEVT
jgi:hypothetical protein